MTDYQRTDNVSMDKRNEHSSAIDLLKSLNCYTDAVSHRDYVGVAQGPRYLENRTDAAAIEAYVDQRVKAMREDVEATMHDFAHSAEVALCEDPLNPGYASAMETAGVRLRAILETD